MPSDRADAESGPGRDHHEDTTIANSTTGAIDPSDADPSDCATDEAGVCVAGPVDAGCRLDRFLAAKLTQLSRERIKALIGEGCVAMDGATIRDPSHKVKPGQSFTVSLPAAAPAALVGEPIPLVVLYEDEHLIVIDKPAGLVVHPAGGHDTGTLVHALIAHCGDSLSGIGGVRRPGIVHRLDKDTTGVMVAAKTDAAHQGLTEQFASHGADGRLVRAYTGLCWGAPRPPAGRIAADLGRSLANRTRISVMAPGRGGRHAVTHYKVEAELSPQPGEPPVASVVRLELETGRTHQIRVHMAHLGHPLLGDPVYATGFQTRIPALAAPAREALTALGRQALHAGLLGFEHPVTLEPLQFQSPMPADMVRLIEALAPPAAPPRRSPGRKRRA